MVKLENRDTLIEYERRIREGAFYTPLIWAAEAHKMLDEELGPNWREEYVVWDCAAGLGNLTKGYEFAELYQSTLSQEDIDLMLEAGVNPGAAKFQFDFLNDPIPGDGLIEGDVCKLPPGLRKALEEGRRFVFLINPPFGTAQANSRSGVNKEGVANTSVHGVMDLGRSKSQLYTQFMFRISKIVEEFELDDSILALYSKPLFISGPSFKRFRDYFYNAWSFKGGFLFRADEFSSVSGQWGCSFSIWVSGQQDNDKISLSVLEREADTISNLGPKIFSPVKNTMKRWATAPRELWFAKSDKDVMSLSSAIRYRKSSRPTGTVNGMLGYFVFKGGDIYNAKDSMHIVSSSHTSGNGLFIFPINLLRVTTSMMVGMVTEHTWINDKDIFREPKEDLKLQQWMEDSLIYSLFHSSSHQSSLRDIECEGETWNIENEFFWMSNDEIKQLAIENDFQELIKDCERFDKDRYVFKILKELDLSQDAQDLLNFSKELIRLSFPLRQEAHNLKPEFHLDAWDAGWYQIRRGILQEHFPNEYEEFRQMYRKFEDRLRPGVYKFGFLKDE